MRAITYKNQGAVLRVEDGKLTITASSDTLTRIQTPVLVYHELSLKPNELVKGVWDTGASSSGISRRLAKLLGLEPKGYTIIKTYQSSRGRKETLHDLDIRFTMNIEKTVRVHTLPDSLGVDLLIGMDVISTGTMTIRHNKDGKLVWTFKF